MIPTASTLAAILNDPAIPAEAKPDWMRRRSHTAVHVEDQEGDYLKVVDKRGYSVFSLYHKEAHHALFWSLSAWLLERREPVFVDKRRDMFHACDSWGIEHDSLANADTPLEALAAVVRAVANPVD